MKKNFTTHGKLTLITSLGVLIVLILASQSVAGGREDVSRDIYFKVFQGADLIPDQNGEVHVSCDSYDDHSFYYFMDPNRLPSDTVITQYDMILGVTALCHNNPLHLDPIFHVDGNQADYQEWIDTEDGFLDLYYAIVGCKNFDPEYVYAIEPPVRVVLECVDHDAIVTKK